MLKKIKAGLLIIEVTLIVLLCFFGCATNTDAHTDNTTCKTSKAYVKMPDGTCISGSCDDFTRWSVNFVSVTIDGVTYCTSDYNICIVES